MPQVTPFRSIRPIPELADRIAALPYDVYNRREALDETLREPLSFLKIAIRTVAAPMETPDRISSVC